MSFQSPNGFASWFFGIPPIVQIAFIVLIVAITILILIATYYLVKGTLYLVYYILKAVFFLVSRLLKGILYAITGKTISKKEKPEIRTKTPGQGKVIEQPIQNKKIIEKYTPPINYFCSDCGLKFSDKMMYRINTKGVAFCVQCGKGFKLVEYDAFGVQTNSMMNS